MLFLKEYPQLILIKDTAVTLKVKVYLVGGFLRDHFLQRDRMDFDFAVSQNALKLARRFAKKIKGAYVVLDQERGCARVVRKEKGKIFTFDFADFRAKTLRGDLVSRDFTINTLCLDLQKIDPAVSLSEQTIDLQKGLRDLKAKRLSMTSPKVFQDDPLRLLRAYSLRAALGFKIDKKTLARIKKEKDLIRDVSPERIREELFKILTAQDTGVILKEMDSIGLLEAVIPQVHVMFGVKQGGYHHLDVWPHSIETVVQMDKVFQENANPKITAYLDEPLSGEHKRLVLMKLAALLHDIGKPQTRKKEKGRVSFHGHEHVGKSIVRSVARMLKLSTHERHALEDMVRWHLRPGYLSNFKSPSKRAVFRYFRDTKEEAISILLLSLADQRSTRGPLTTKRDQEHHEKIIRTLIAEYFAEQDKEPVVRLIDGNDLIKKLKLKPSPLFAEILSAVEEQQALGAINTKKDALDFARAFAKKRKAL